VPRAVFWTDTCYAGVGRDGQPLLQGTRFAVPTYATRTASGAVLRWTAAGPGQLSEAHPASRHGAFTWASLRALQGEADGELDGARDGAVTGAEAHAFVVRALATEGIRQQTPSLEGDGAFVFASGLPAAAPVPTLPVPLAPAPRPAPRPVATSDGPDGGRLKLAAVLGGASLAALGTAVATRSMYVSAGPEQGSLDGLVAVNQAAGWAGIALGVGAISLTVTAL